MTFLEKGLRFPYTYNIDTSSSFQDFSGILIALQRHGMEDITLLLLLPMLFHGRSPTKQDLGIDFSFFNDKLTGAV